MTAPVPSGISGLLRPNAFSSAATVAPTPPPAAAVTDAAPPASASDAWAGAAATSSSRPGSCRPEDQSAISAAMDSPNIGVPPPGRRSPLARSQRSRLSASSAAFSGRICGGGADGVSRKGASPPPCRRRPNWMRPLRIKLMAHVSPAWQPVRGVPVRAPEETPIRSGNLGKK
jgi:hypothetical protein